MLARLLLGAMLATATTNAAAQVIQLPSFSNVGVNTTVIVPDSGGARMSGGDRRANYGFSTFGGVPRQQGWGIRRQSADMNVTAQIHDPQAADAALRASVVRRDALQPSTQPLNIGAGSAGDDVPLGSIAELAERRRQQAADTQREALTLVDKARQAHAAGKTSVAAIYFRMAARQATGELRDSIVAEQNRLSENSAAAARGEP